MTVTDEAEVQRLQEHIEKKRKERGLTKSHTSTVRDILQQFSKAKNQSIRKTDKEIRKIFYKELLATRDPRGFGQLSHGLMASPELGKLSEKEYRVLMSFCSFRNFKTGLTSPGYNNVMEHMQNWKPTFGAKNLQRIVRSICSKGFLFLLHDPCPKRATTFYIPEDENQRRMIEEYNKSVN